MAVIRARSNFTGLLRGKDKDMASQTISAALAFLMQHKVALGKILAKKAMF